MVAESGSSRCGRHDPECVNTSVRIRKPTFKFRTGPRCRGKRRPSNNYATQADSLCHYTYRCATLISPQGSGRVD